MLKIDGSEKSGSGTIVRYSVALASLLKKDLHLINIRQKREKRGLRPQHLKALHACEEMTNGKLEKAEVESQEIIYHPGKIIKGGKYSWDIGTAGSTTMLAQTIIPLGCFASSPCTFEITGGLFQDFAPAAHHLQLVVLPLLKKMGLDISLEIERPGYVPTGNGIIKIKVIPTKKKLSPIILEDQGEITEIKGIALSSHLEQQKVSERMIISCNKILNKSNLSADIKCEYDTTALQRGASLTVYIKTSTGCLIGMDIAGKLGRTSEFIGEKVAKKLMKDFNAKATVDRYTADQLILYAALADGTSKYIIPKMTDHIETNLWLVEKILKAKIEIENNTVIIHGIGYLW